MEGLQWCVAAFSQVKYKSFIEIIGNSPEDFAK